MNLIWHLAKKDFRRLLIPSGVFVLLLSAKLLLGSQMLDAMDYSQFATLTDYLRVAVVSELIFSLVLVAAIVQEDPLCGSRAFWMTRPISGLQLLAAKLLVLGIVVVLLPAVIALPWWMLCDLDLLGTALAATRVLTQQALIVALGLPFAVLTPTLPRYIGCWLGTCVLFVVAASRMRKVVSAEHPNLPFGAAATSSVVIAIILGFTLVALVVHQYRTRRLLRSISIAATGVLLAVVTNALWRWDWSPDRASRETNALQLANIQLDVQGAGLRANSEAALGDHRSITARLSGLPHGYITDTVFMEQRWTWSDGTMTTLHQAPQPSPAIEDIIADQLGLFPGHSGAGPAGADPTKTSTHAIDMTLSGSWPSDLASKVRNQPRALTVNMRTRLLRPTVVGEVALEPGASLTSAGHTSRVLRVGSTTKRRIDLSIIDIASSRRDRPLGFFPEFLLIDRTTGQVMRFHQNRTETTPVAGVSVATCTVILDPSMAPVADGRTSGQSVDAARFHLARVSYEVVGHLRRSVELPHLPVQID